MSKLIATLCVISWSGFWAFGYLALTESTANPTGMMVDAVLAGICFLTGVFAYLRLCRDRPLDYIRVHHR